MFVVEKVQYLSPDKYLEREQRTEARHEYVAGRFAVDASWHTIGSLAIFIHCC
jgi:hypothetical protein